MSAQVTAELRRQILLVAARRHRDVEVRSLRPTVSLPHRSNPRASLLILGRFPLAHDDSVPTFERITIAYSSKDSLDTYKDHLFCSLPPTAESSLLWVRPDDMKVDLKRLSERWIREVPKSLEESNALFSDAELRSDYDPAIQDCCFSMVCCSDLWELAPTADRQKKVLREVFRVLEISGIARFVVDLADEVTSVNRFTEAAFLEELEICGFHGIRIVSREKTPTAVLSGAELRTFVIDANRGKEGPCYDHRQAVMYLGPWRKVFDDDGHSFERGVRSAVCEKTFAILTREPYCFQTIGIEPYCPADTDDETPFTCRNVTRPPSVTKGTHNIPDEPCC